MTKNKRPLISKSYKPNPKFSLEVLDNFQELKNWLKQISRLRRLESFVFISDYKKGEIRLRVLTKDHQYSIFARLPSREEKTCKYCGSSKVEKLETGDTEERFIGCSNCGKDMESKWGYLGCIATTRKPRAGENWNRGNDLADGGYCKETWREIKDDILAYELVKVVRNSPNKD